MVRTATFHPARWVRNRSDARTWVTSDHDNDDNNAIPCTILSQSQVLRLCYFMFLYRKLHCFSRVWLLCSSLTSEGGWRGEPAQGRAERPRMTAAATK